MESSQKQFVIQEHTTPEGVHWDLMLEMDDCLWTWRLNIPPEKIMQAPVSAEPIFDHPPRFLTYEGPVQNNTGNVKIADKGTYHIIKQLENMLAFALHGKILIGTFSLSKTTNTPFWTLKPTH